MQGQVSNWNVQLELSPMEISASALGIRDTYNLMTSLVVPRPIAWVSTRSGSGVTNLAPFSYFNGVGSDPPTVFLSIGNQRDGTEKDTLRNIRETGVYCIHLVEDGWAEKMNLTSGLFRPDESEFEMAQIDTVPCESINGVRILGARACMECKLIETHIYGRRSKNNVVIGEVSHFFIDDPIVDQATRSIDPQKIEPLARLGGPNYATLGKRFRLERPDVDALRLERNK
jgi:flavin reductase (DIM6/NTAB) family NADH-FMN oxidoreductase RutF